MKYTNNIYFEHILNLALISSYLFHFLSFCILKDASPIDTTLSFLSHAFKGLYQITYCREKRWYNASLPTLPPPTNPTLLMDEMNFLNFISLSTLSHKHSRHVCACVIKSTKATIEICNYPSMDEWHSNKCIALFSF